MGEYDFTLGIDLACSAAHVATLMPGRLVWSNHRFRTAAVELEGLWRQGSCGGSPAAGDGAHPEYVGAVGGLVQSPRRHSDLAAAPVCSQKGKRRMTTTAHGHQCSLAASRSTALIYT